MKHFKIFGQIRFATIKVLLDIQYKSTGYELSHQLQNDLRLNILGITEIVGTPQNKVQKFGSSSQKLHKNKWVSFLVQSHITPFSYFILKILSTIVGLKIYFYDEMKNQLRLFGCTMTSWSCKFNTDQTRKAFCFKF